MSFLFPKIFYEGPPHQWCGRARFFRPCLPPDLLFFVEQDLQITSKKALYLRCFCRLLWKSNTPGKHLFNTVKALAAGHKGQILCC
jgi:hypothetical protein